MGSSIRQSSLFLKCTQLPLCGSEYVFSHLSRRLTSWRKYNSKDIINNIAVEEDRRSFLTTDPKKWRILKIRHLKPLSRTMRRMKVQKIYSYSRGQYHAGRLIKIHRNYEKSASLIALKRLSPKISKNNTDKNLGLLRPLEGTQHGHCPVLENIKIQI